MADKLGAYLGLCRRAGKLTLGLNTAETLKRCRLLLADETLGENSRKQVEKLRKKLSCPLAYCEDLGTLVSKPGCKVAAVREEHLAEAILGVLRERSNLVSEE